MTPTTSTVGTARGVGEDAHQADVPAAVDHADAAAGQHAQCLGRRAIVRAPGLEPQKTHNERIEPRE